MSVIEIKSELIELISTVQEENLLLQLRNTVKRIIAKEDDWWDELSPELQEELKQSIEESYDPQSWIEYADFKKNNAKWFKG